VFDQIPLVAFSITQVCPAPEFDMALEALVTSSMDPNAFEGCEDFDWGVPCELEIGSIPVPSSPANYTNQDIADEDGLFYDNLAITYGEQGGYRY
jgi:hypothetical protein